MLLKVQCVKKKKGACKMVTIQSNKNMHIVTIGNKSICFSYQTLVAMSRNGYYYKTKKHYSATTSKHINLFLHGSNPIELEQSELENLAAQ
jgi:hypothetical protein